MPRGAGCVGGPLRTAVGVSVAYRGRAGEALAYLEGSPGPHAAGVWPISKPGSHFCHRRGNRRSGRRAAVPGPASAGKGRGEPETARLEEFRRTRRARPFSADRAAGGSNSQGRTCHQALGSPTEGVGSRETRVKGAPKRQTLKQQPWECASRQGPSAHREERRRHAVHRSPSGAVSGDQLFETGPGAVAKFVHVGEIF